MKMKHVYIIALLLALTSCAPDLFTLNRGIYNSRIYGLKMTSLDDVEVVNDNSIIIRNNGIAALAIAEKTQFEADLTVKLLSGHGLRFAFRTVSDNYSVHPAIFFDYTTDGSNVRENDHALAAVDSVKAKINQPSRIKIINDGKVFTILADCDTVYLGRTEIPATEYIIIESLRSSEALLSGINFADIRSVQNFY
jgi:hypothetical protein